MKLDLSRLKSNKVFMKHLRLDVTPELIFKPRFVRDRSDRAVIDEVQGFMFYIDYMNDMASLMVMKTYNLTSKTVGEITDAPKDMLLRAVKREGVKDISFMFPISEEVESWIKRGLDLSP